MACVAWPESVRRMRFELDRICGSDAHRLPNLDDLANAPFSSAIVKEVLRWRPTVPLIPQRVLTQNLEFEEHMFPSGTEPLVNTVSACSYGFDEATSFKSEQWFEREYREHSDMRGDLTTENSTLLLPDSRSSLGLQ
ncbi:hypothetical protein GGR58DRAFT_12340 [Xylaria digitata]|nr:hypothetical protein GGR58DRAFT_12340 [Xylaria digitata]